MQPQMVRRGWGGPPSTPRAPQSPARDCSRRGGRLAHRECHLAAVTQLPQPRAPLGLGRVWGLWGLLWGLVWGLRGCLTHKSVFARFQAIWQSSPPPKSGRKSDVAPRERGKAGTSSGLVTPGGTPGTPAAGSGAGSSGRPCQGRTNARLSSIPSVFHQKQQNEACKSSSPVVPEP